MPEPLASATGRRKSATANVQMFPGSGTITINGKPVLDYLKRVDPQCYLDMLARLKLRK